MNFTFNNHIKYSIGNRLYGYRTNSYENFTVSLGKIDETHYKQSDFRKELLRTADLIYNDYKKDFIIFLSGGTDSEIVVRNFLDIGILPRCVTIKFNNDYNIEDVQEAIDLTNSLNVPLEIFNFDVKTFFDSGEAEEFGKSIQCTQIAYLIVYNVVKKMNLPSIMGGELLLRRNVNTTPSTWYYCLRENEDCSAMRFSNLYNIPLVNEYFSYTPELMLYYLENPDIKNLVSEKNNFKLSSVSSKNKILKSLLPDIRSRIKTHGFEKLLAFNYIAYRTLMNTQIMRLEPSLDGVEYNNAIKMLRGEI